MKNLKTKIVFILSTMICVMYSQFIIAKDQSKSNSNLEFINNDINNNIKNVGNIDKNPIKNLEVLGLDATAVKNLEKTIQLSNKTYKCYDKLNNKTIYLNIEEESKKYKCQEISFNIDNLNAKSNSTSKMEIIRTSQNEINSKKNTTVSENGQDFSKIKNVIQKNNDYNIMLLQLSIHDEEEEIFTKKEKQVALYSFLESKNYNGGNYKEISRLNLEIKEHEEHIDSLQNKLNRIFSGKK